MNFEKTMASALFGFLLFAFNLFGQKKTMQLSDSVNVLKIIENSRKIKNNPDSIFQLAKQALAISEEIRFSKGIALAKSRMTSYYMAKSDFATAVKVNLEAIDSFEKLGMIEESLLQRLSLSTIYKSMGAERGTIEYLMKGLKIAQEVEKKIGNSFSKFILVEALNNQAIILRDLSHIQNKPMLMDSAFLKFQKAIKILEKTQDNPQILQMLYNNISMVYIESKKDYEKATEVLNKAIAINHKINNLTNLTYNYSNVSNLYKAKKDYKKAKEYALKMLNISNQIKRPHRVLNAYSQLKKISALMMEYDSAYYYSEKMSALNDSLTNLSKTEKIAELQTKYESVKKDAEIKDLNLKTEIARIRNFALIGGLILLGFLAVLFYSGYLLKKKTSEELSTKNIEIERKNELIQTSLGEKETLLREIHHRVKNNLQIISSLLNIQSDNINDPTLQSNIREGQNRVQAMSLIHQNLYQSEHLSNVDIENYLKELVVYLSEMFEKEDKKIEVEVIANHIEFDIDTAIPLGLIVNELVSNAYKYAFENQETGKIKIDIMALNDIEYELNVNDDGKGLPTDFDPSKSKSLGLKLVKILSKQLRGKFSSSSDKGANFRVLFKDIRAFQLSQK